MSLTGPTTYGTPSSSNTNPGAFKTNPNAYASFNTSPMNQRIQSQMGTQIGNQQQNALSNASALNGGRSGGTQRLLNDVAAQGENRATDITNQNSQASFGQQLGQMAENNQFNLQNAQIQNQKYATDIANQNYQQALRRQALSNVPGGDILNLIGNY